MTFVRLFVRLSTRLSLGLFIRLFFDWSACRYTSHDGYGSRGLGPTCTWAGGSFSDDAQTYGPESEAHTPVGASD